MGFLAGPDYLALPRPEYTWLIKDVLPVGGQMNIFGKPKLGKSTLALQLAAALGAGLPSWMGFGIPNKATVAYLQIDTPRSLWTERIESFAAHGLDFSNVYFADDQEVPIPFDILDPATQLWLTANVDAIPTPPAVMIIDTTREIHDGPEDESEQMKKIVSALRAALPHAAIVLISHARKGSGGYQQPGYTPDLMDENRGSGYIAGKMDCVLWLQEKQLQAKGRALPHTQIDVAMDPETKLIRMTDSFHVEGVRLVESAPPGASVRDIARELSARYPKKSYEACRSLVRRLRS